MRFQVVLMPTRGGSPIWTPDQQQIKVRDSETKVVSRLLARYAPEVKAENVVLAYAGSPYPKGSLRLVNRRTGKNILILSVL